MIAVIVAVLLFAGILGVAACLGGHEAQRDNVLDGHGLAPIETCLHPASWLVYDGMWEPFLEQPAFASVTCRLCGTSKALPVREREKEVA